MSEQPVDPPKVREPGDSPSASPVSEEKPPPPAIVEDEANVDSLSAMTPRFNLPLRWFANRFFGHFDLDDATVEHLRKLEAGGSVIYVMRYASRLDYFLFNALFIREGLGLSKFANGIRFYYYRPIWQAIRLAWKRRGEWLREPGPEFSQAKLRALTSRGESSFIFLRTARLRSRLRSRRSAVEHGKSELDLLEEVVRTVWDSNHSVHVVPLALFWRRGPRGQQRFLNLSYGASTRPSDFTKVSSFLTTYRGLCVRVGDSIDLGAFAAERRAEGPHRIARKVRRIALTFLYREEKVVEGPALRPPHRIEQAVIGAPAVVSHRDG
jgi:glycerol-3-phosphate O-acyltransferase